MYLFEEMVENSMKNLNFLHASEENLSPPQKSSLANFLVGALASYINPEDWKTIVNQSITLLSKIERRSHV